VTRRTRLLAISLLVALGALGVGAQGALANSTVYLGFPSGDADSFFPLCSGIQVPGILQTDYPNGFDPTSGYPTGLVYATAECSGSGRGGGGHTEGSLWIAVTWDYAGTVVGASVTSAPVSPPDPTATYFDSYGNELYKSGAELVLQYAPTFTPQPHLFSLSTSQGPASGGTSVTISGDGLSEVTGVDFGSTPAASFTINGDNSITAVAPPETPGSVDVTVTSAGGTSATSTFDQFTFVGAPTVTSISPRSGSWYGGTLVTINGAYLGAVTAVYFGGMPATIFSNDGTTIQAYAPNDTGGESNTVDVTVASVGGTSPTSAADVFTYVEPPATVYGVTPGIGPASGGTSVTITGVGFTGALRVRFGSVAARFKVDADSIITATAPRGAIGTVDVTVTTIQGTSATSSADLYTYAGPPTVSGLSPTSGSTLGGTPVTISGAGFSGATAVDFGTTPALSFSVESDGSISAVAPAHAAGFVFVRVIGPTGTSRLARAALFDFKATAAGALAKRPAHRRRTT
jgi:spore coat protein U-like protein